MRSFREQITGLVFDTYDLNVRFEIDWICRSCGGSVLCAKLLFTRWEPSREQRILHTVHGSTKIPAAVVDSLCHGKNPMAKDRFLTANPYPDVQVSEEERHQLIQMVDGYVYDYFQEYEKFVCVDKHKVDERRWEHVKSKDNLRIYSERSRTKRPSKTRLSMNIPSSTATRNDYGTSDAQLPVMLSVGTCAGDMDDLMFGVVSPTLDIIRIKASYVHDIDSAAILCSVVEPSEDEPFRSLVVKWMTIDVPLQSTTLVKCRDYVYIEATGILHFTNGDRVGYHLLHSIDFPVTKPLPNKIRGNMSVFGFFRQIEENVIDVFACGIVAPGGDLPQCLLIPAAAEALLAATNYVYCGQMKKLAWMLHRRHSSDERQGQGQHTDACVMCMKATTKNRLRRIGKSTCKLCRGTLCYPCKIRRRLSFITPDGRLVQRKLSFCTKCVNMAIKGSAQEAAREQAGGCMTYDALSSISEANTVKSSMF